MIQEFVERWYAEKDNLALELAKGHPDDYKSLVRLVIKTIIKTDDDLYPDPGKIEEISFDDEYQGTLIYVIGCNGYMPDKYWYLKIRYGSCSVCDTLESIKSYSHDPPTEDQISDYMTLALHIIQCLKVMDDEVI